MDNFDKTCAEYLALARKSNAVAGKASLVIAMAGQVQELLNLNQQLASSLAELVEIVTNERKAKNTNPDGGTVP